MYFKAISNVADITHSQTAVCISCYSILNTVIFDLNIFNAYRVLFQDKTSKNQEQEIPQK